MSVLRLLSVIPCVFIWSLPSYEPQVIFMGRPTQLGHCSLLRPGSQCIGTPRPERPSDPANPGAFGPARESGPGIRRGVRPLPAESPPGPDPRRLRARARADRQVRGGRGALGQPAGAPRAASVRCAGRGWKPLSGMRRKG